MKRRCRRPAHSGRHGLDDMDRAISIAVSAECRAPDRRRFQIPGFPIPGFPIRRRSQGWKARRRASRACSRASAPVT